MFPGLREFAKRAAFSVGIGAPRYPYNIEPVQLATLVNEIDRLAGVEGSILEIGVSRGMTTRFLAEHLRGRGNGQRIHAIDTFNSFTSDDLDYEVKHRGKRRKDIRGFEYITFDRWRRNFEGLPVIPVQADAAKFDYASLAPIKLAFLDIDLYLPTRAALPRVYEHLVPGGAILIDDCRAGMPWDGALQAYTEFCATLGVSPQIVGSKCGALRK
jgi:predicted O-methyltransferase YrrM